MSHIDEGLLHARLDGALAPDDPEWRAARRHLEACADCRRRFESARALRAAAGELLAGSTPDPAPRPNFADLAAAASARRRERPPTSATGGGRARWWRSPAKLAWAASLVLAVGAGWMGRALLETEGGGAAAVQLADTASETRGTPARTSETGAREGAARPQIEGVRNESLGTRAAAPPGAAADADRAAAAQEPAPSAGDEMAPQRERAQLAAPVREDARKAEGAVVPPGCYAAATADGPVDLRVDSDRTARFRRQDGLYVGFWQRRTGGGMTLELTDRTDWIQLVLEPTADGVRGTLGPGTLDVRLSLRAVACPSD
ncbi:MAG: zf-HC2 domain-containing protein [Gemmatimonadales bacterium]|jgi:hypothetical protein